MKVIKNSFAITVFQSMYNNKFKTRQLFETNTEWEVKALPKYKYFWQEQSLKTSTILQRRVCSWSNRQYLVFVGKSKSNELL
jgi:hypothetical protein